LFGRVGAGQLATFCRQAAAYLDAGVDINKALTNLRSQYAMTALGPVIGRLQASVKRGESLAEAVGREPQAFDPLFLAMIRVAEARGGIPETLRHLGHHYEARQRLIRQARSAMIYPVIVLTLASGVIALLTIWLLPMFASMLKELPDGGQLPLPSRVLMGLSWFVGKVGWLLIPVVFLGGPFLLFQAYRTASGKKLMDRLALWIPVFGPLLTKLDTSRFARSLASLLEAGVDVGSSLDLARGIVRLDPYRQAIASVREQVLHGAELSEALQETGRFGPDVIAVVNSGEETGKLPESLDHLANDYEEQVEYTVKNLGQLIQPLMIVVLGGIVLFIILAVLLPYINMLTGLSKPGGL
jgi:type II secretory pathway component PulF